MEKERNEKGKEVKSQGKKKVLWILGLCLVLILALLGGFVFYQNSRDSFYSNTKVNGEKIGGLSAKEAAVTVNQNLQNTNVTVTEDGQNLLTTSLGNLGYSVDETWLEGQLEGLIKTQKKNIFGFLKSVNYILEYPLTLDETAFTGVLTSETFAGTRIPSENAKIQYDGESMTYVVVPEVKGTVIDDQALQTAVKEKVEEFNKSREKSAEIDLTLDSSLMAEPEVTSDSDEIQTQLTKLNELSQKYHNMTVTYLLGGSTEVLTSEEISSWIVADDSGMTFSEDAVRTYVENLATKYNTIYAQRQFQTSAGETVTIENNEYGYQIDQDGEYQQLMAELQAGDAVEREPLYSISGFQRNGTDDLAGSYIEVSLSDQYLWLYKDGVLITETPIVSGTDKEETATYKGAWPIPYKASPFTLSSDYYGYELVVDYWMPFVYGQGLHDADWRTSFGGDIYKTDGSHGCVNLPEDQAKLIYETIDGGYPIILY